MLLFGHYLEAKSGQAAGDALQEVAKLLPKKAHRVTGEGEENVPVAELARGDTVIVKPGEKIPADGIIVEGAASVNEALVSGESKPLSKAVDDEVVAGSINMDGSITVRLTRVGEHSTVGQIQQLISDAQQTKPRSQRLADKAAGLLTFVAAGAAVIAFIVWAGVIGESVVFAITISITVLVIACPHALGLAIPTVTTITTSEALKHGIFIKDLASVEEIKNADYVVFDKTGTLTTGDFGVSRVLSFGGMSEEEVLARAASLERHSSHIIGRAIVQEAEDRGVSEKEVTSFVNVAGKGVQGEIEGETHYAGRHSFLAEQGIDMSKADRELRGESGTLVFVASRKSLHGVIVLADAIKPASRQAVVHLHNAGITVAMLTGDSERVAEQVARELGIDTYFAGVLPDEKYTYIRKLQEDGKTVLMVGDGVNDAPALTQADVGIAIGAGTDVAVEAGEIVLTENDPGDVVRLVVLARKVYRKMVQNLFWALGYNVIAIPAAAGALAPWGVFLRPEVGALLMSGSTVVVVINALTLKRIRLDETS